MSASQNKLRNKKKNKLITIYIGIILFILTFLFMCYCTYVYLGYSKTSPDTSLMENMLYIAQNLLFKAESLSYEINAKEILMIQVKKLWWIYLSIPVFIFLIETSKIDNDFRGVEHGSAKWADKHDEKQFKDDTGIPIAKDFYVTVDGKKGAYEPHNLNQVIISGSGGGKTFRGIKPHLMQMFGSYVVTDPKGELFRDTYKLLKENGYDIKVLNLLDIHSSNQYNPFAYIHSEEDVLDVADLFIKNASGESKEDFWFNSAKELLTAIMMYLFKTEHEVKSFGRVLRLVNSLTYDNKGKIDPICELAQVMEEHKRDNPMCQATIAWNGVLGTPKDTLGGITKMLSTSLAPFGIGGVDTLTAEDEMDFKSVGIKKTAIFLIIRPARNQYKAIANIFYTQLFEQLQNMANFGSYERDGKVVKCNGRLPIHVSCELDEFANLGVIPSFSETLSVVRSCNIRICIVLQGLEQLKAMYKDTYKSIVGNCSIFTLLGNTDEEAKKYVVEQLGKTTVRVGTRSYNRGNTGGGSDSENYTSRDLLTFDEVRVALRPKGKTKKYGGSCIVIIDELPPFFLPKFDTLSHPLIDKVGSFYSKDFHNNTDVKELYKGINEDKKKIHEQKTQAEIDKSKEIEKAKLQKEEEEMEKKKLEDEELAKRWQIHPEEIKNTLEEEARKAQQDTMDSEDEDTNSYTDGF